MIDATRRFSDRVADYVAARPGYPAGVTGVLADVCGCVPGDPVADVGSGTGIFSADLLRQGYEVWAVEPNAPMRAAAERALGKQERFHSLAGCAEATGLEDGSMRAVTVAQAFHWFDARAVRKEFRRILAPGGWVALVWNERSKTASPFLRAYEAFLVEHGTDYRRVGRTRFDTRAVGAALDVAEVVHRRFENRQRLDERGLERRVLSCSYVPAPGQPGHADMMCALARLFADHARQGAVTIEYATDVYAVRPG